MSDRTRNNLAALTFVALVCSTIFFTGCVSDWRECTPGQVFRDEGRKFGLCDVDRRVPQRDYHKF